MPDRPSYRIVNHGIQPSILMGPGFHVLFDEPDEGPAKDIVDRLNALDDALQTAYEHMVQHGRHIHFGPPKEQYEKDLERIRQLLTGRKSNEVKSK